MIYERSLQIINERRKKDRNNHLESESRKRMQYLACINRLVRKGKQIYIYTSAAAALIPDELLAVPAKMVGMRKALQRV
jgi:hypothetical protein